MKISKIIATHPSDLFDELDEMFEDDWLEWDPETLIEHFPALRLVDGNDDDLARDKILAIQAIASNSQVIQTDYRAFEKVITAFNNQHVVSDAIQPAEIEEIVYGINEISKIVKKVHGIDIEFIGEIPIYIAAVAKFYGWVVLPTALNFAQESFEILTRVGKGGTRYTENKNLIDSAKVLSKRLVTANLDITAIDSLEDDSKANIIARRLLGANLYDPTLVSE